MPTIVQQVPCLQSTHYSRLRLSGVGERPLADNQSIRLTKNVTFCQSWPVGASLSAPARITVILGESRGSRERTP